MLTLQFALCAVLAMQSAAAEPELLPAPSGPHKTGRASFHWQDAQRDELETSAPDDKRELMVHVFYPADGSASGERAPYVPDAEVMRGPWKDDQVARITTMRAYSLENAPLPPGNARYPVIVFVPGGGMKGLTYQALVEDLASHGWVVAAIDPPYNARGVRFPDGRVLGNLEPIQRGWPRPKNAEEFGRFYRERIVHGSRDASFVIDELARLDQGDGPLAGRLDLSRGVGVLGHSRGGQAAGTVRLLDQRVRGGVNLDGMAGERPILPVKDDDASGTQPFLWIQKSLPPPPSDEQLQKTKHTRAEYDAEVQKVLAGWQRGLNEVAGGAMLVRFNRPEITHIDFSDEPFWDGSLTDQSRPGKLQTIAETRAWVRAFFDGTLRGEWAALEKLAGQKSPDVNVQVFGRLWP